MKGAAHAIDADPCPLCSHSLQRLNMEDESMAPGDVVAHSAMLRKSGNGELEACDMPAHMALELRASRSHRWIDGALRWLRARAHALLLLATLAAAAQWLFFWFGP